MSDDTAAVVVENKEDLKQFLDNFEAEIKFWN